MATSDMKNNISLDTSASVDLTFSTTVVNFIVCADEERGSCLDPVMFSFVPRGWVLVKSALMLRNDPVAFKEGWIYHCFISERVVGERPNWHHLCGFRAEAGESFRMIGRFCPKQFHQWVWRRYTAWNDAHSFIIGPPFSISSFWCLFPILGT